MQVIYTPTLPPGCCFICRGAVRDSYIDTGVSQDFDGAAYICDQCVGEMARMQAFMSFDEYKDLRAAKEDLERQTFALIKRVGELENIHDAVVRAGYKFDGDGPLVRVGGYIAGVDEIPEDRSSEQGISLGVGEGETSEQSYDKGMDELHSDESSSNDEFALEF